VAFGFFFPPPLGWEVWIHSTELKIQLLPYRGVSPRGSCLTSNGMLVPILAPFPPEIVDLAFRYAFLSAFFFPTQKPVSLIWEKRDRPGWAFGFFPSLEEFALRMSFRFFGGCLPLLARGFPLKGPLFRL